MAPSSSISPSKKLLITDPKPKSLPKSDPSAAPPTSAASTASPDRRSRDQPNLSDCHCCGYRIDQTNPKDRLQLLDSIWRIVLLCRDCRKAIRFGRKCPYCFQETGKSGNLVQCGGCERRIHRDCVRDSGNCRPWCYLGARLEGFRVCVDCWVPELLKNSFTSESEGGLKDKVDGKNLLGKAVKKVKRKAEKAVNVRERPSKGINVTRNGVDLANVVLALPAMNYKGSFRVENSNSASESGRDENLDCDGNGARPENSNIAADGADGLRAESAEGAAEDVGAENLNSAAEDVRAENLEGVRAQKLDGAEAVDDAKLAIQLHRAMNSSPRISRSKCTVNSSSLVVLSIRDWNGLRYKRHGSGRICSGGRRLEAYSDNMHSERMSQPGESDLCSDVNGLNLGLLPYKRDKKRKIWQLIEDDTIVPELPSYLLAEMKFSSHSDDSRILSLIKNSADTMEASLDSNAVQSNLCTSVNRFGQEFVGYNRTRFRKKVCKVVGRVSVSAECSSSDNITGALKSDSCQLREARIGAGFLAKSGAEETLLSGSCDAIGDSGHAETATHQSTLESENLACAPALGNSEARCSGKLGEELNLPDQTSNRDRDPYCYKYAKRTKGSNGLISKANLHAVTFLSEIEASAAGLTTNCSAESRTVSDVSFDSFTNNLPK